MILHFVVPGDPDTLTGGYLYDRRISEGLQANGWTVQVHTLDPRFPFPDDEALHSARIVLDAIPRGSLVVMDGLALGAMPDLLAEQAGRFTLVALVHHPLAAETGLDTESAHGLFLSERRALTYVPRVIVTSESTARALRSYGVERGRIGVVVPGTDRGRRAVGSSPCVTSLLCVAALIPRKGHIVLIDALAQIQDTPWHLTCIGSAERSPGTTRAIADHIGERGLAKRVTLAGEMGRARLSEHYLASDLFVLASHMEGYGMALAEALSHGLPVVSTTAGAIPATVPAEAALLVPPGDCEALRDALRTLLVDPELRHRMADAAWSAGLALPTWEEASGRFARELERSYPQ